MRLSGSISGLHKTICCFMLFVVVLLAVSCRNKGKGGAMPPMSKQGIEELFTKAGRGNADAQFNLAACYYQGNGVAQNYTEAARFCRKAAEQGHTKAQYDLGSFYRMGLGVPQDDTEAAKWYRKAAEQGHPQAQFYLAASYMQGKGVPQDYIEAYAWSCLSVANGETKASNLRDVVGKGLSPKALKQAQARVATLVAPRSIAPHS